jgi:catalase
MMDPYLGRELFASPRRSVARDGGPPVRRRQWAAMCLLSVVLVTGARSANATGEHWRSFSKDGQAYLIKAMAADLNHVTDHGIKLREVSYFYKADRDYGTQLAQATHLDLNAVAALAAKEVAH